METSFCTKVYQLVEFIQEHITFLLVIFVITALWLIGAIVYVVRDIIIQGGIVMGESVPDELLQSDAANMQETLKSARSLAADDLADRLDVAHPLECQMCILGGERVAAIPPEEYARLYEYAEKLEDALVDLEAAVTYTARFRDRGPVISALIAARTALVVGASRSAS